jgi:calcium-dependent protein kinase
LIKKLICKPEIRLSAQEALNHKWFKKTLKTEKGKVMNDGRLKTFKTFANHSKMKQAALTAISVQASPDDIRELKELFKNLDKNGDGSLTLEELRVGLQGKENGETLLSIMESADTDNSGEINYTEFIAATIDANLFMREDYLRTAFEMFDADGSGKIDNEEVKALL